MRPLAPRPLAVLLGGLAILTLSVCARPTPRADRVGPPRVEIWSWERWERARRSYDSTRHVAGDTAIYRAMDSIAGARTGRSVAAYRAWSDSTQASFDTLGRMLATALAAVVRDTALAHGDTAMIRRIDSLVAAEARATRQREPRWKTLRDSALRWTGGSGCVRTWGSPRSRTDTVGASASLLVGLRCVRDRAGEVTAHLDIPLGRGWTVRAARVGTDGLTGAAADSAATMLRAPQPGDTAIRMDVRLRAAAGAATMARVVIEVQGPSGTDPYPRYAHPRDARRGRASR